MHDDLAADAAAAKRQNFASDQLYGICVKTPSVCGVAFLERGADFPKFFVLRGGRTEKNVGSGRLCPQGRCATANAKFFETDPSTGIL